MLNVRGPDQTTGGSVSFHSRPSHLTLFVPHKLTQKKNKKKHANTHTCALLGQVPQEIIIQLQNEDQKCHPLLLRSSSAIPLTPFSSVSVSFFTNPFSFLHTFSTTTCSAVFFCFLKCALFTCPL